MEPALKVLMWEKLWSIFSILLRHSKSISTILYFLTCHVVEPFFHMHLICCFYHVLLNVLIENLSVLLKTHFKNKYMLFSQVVKTKMSMNVCFL